MFKFLKLEHNQILFQCYALFQLLSFQQFPELTCPLEWDEVSSILCKACRFVLGRSMTFWIQEFQRLHGSSCFRNHCQPCAEPLRTSKILCNVTLNGKFHRVPNCCIPSFSIFKISCWSARARRSKRITIDKCWVNKFVEFCRTARDVTQSHKVALSFNGSLISHNVCNNCKDFTVGVLGWRKGIAKLPSLVWWTVKPWSLHHWARQCVAQGQQLWCVWIEASRCTMQEQPTLVDIDHHDGLADDFVALRT